MEAYFRFPDLSMASTISAKWYGYYFAAISLFSLLSTAVWSAFLTNSLQIPAVDYAGVLVMFAILYFISNHIPITTF